MEKKEVVIAGAGKIGRGYLAEVLQSGGYHITFLVHNPAQTEALRAQGSYVIFRGSRDEQSVEQVRIAGYDAFCTETEREACVAAIARAPYIFLPIYPAACADFGRMLAEAIARRAAAGSEEAMDLILCTNFMRATQRLRDSILPHLPEEAKAYFETKVGISETLVNRLCVAPTEEMRRQDPLAISAGYGEPLCIDGEAIRGELPSGPWIAVRDHLPARFVFKIWNINMQHFAVAMYADFYGYSFMREATADPYVEECVRRCASAESIHGVGQEFGMTDAQVRERLFADHWATWANPESDDLPARVAADLRRKLSKEDRLVGPALACLQGGRIPFFLARIIAMALQYQNPADPACREIAACIRERGVAGALREFCGLDPADETERQLMELIEDSYIALHK